MLVVHHVAADGWSLQLFFQELAALYNAELTEDADPLAPVVAQYVDVSRFELASEHNEAAQNSLDYWVHELRGVPAVLDIPGPRRPGLAGRAERVFSRFDQDAFSALEKLCQANHATKFMVLAAALASVLGSLSGDEVVAIGTPFAGRDAPELAGVIGPLVNTLPLRVDLSGDPTFGELVTENPRGHARSDRQPERAAATDCGRAQTGPGEKPSPLVPS